MRHYRDEALVDKVIARIRKLREQKGVTLQEFYNDTNIHLARIESNKRDISISTLSAICKYFGITISEFTRGLWKIELIFLFFLHQFVIYANIDRWQEYQIRIALEDEKSIRKMCSQMKKRVRIEPFENPPL